MSEKKKNQIPFQGHDGTGLDADFDEAPASLAVAHVMEKEVPYAVVGYHDVRPTIVIHITDHDPQGFGLGPPFRGIISDGARIVSPAKPDDARRISRSSCTGACVSRRF